MSQIFKYKLKWDQNMGGNRGILAQVETEDWEVGKMIWRKMIWDAIPEEVRNVEVYCDHGIGIWRRFEPHERWPRPLAVFP